MPSTASGEEQPHAPQHIEKAARQRETWGCKEDTRLQGEKERGKLWYSIRDWCCQAPSKCRDAQGPPANSSEARLFCSTPQGTTCQLHHVSSQTAPSPLPQDNLTRHVAPRSSSLQNCPEKASASKYREYYYKDYRNKEYLILCFLYVTLHKITTCKMFP